jgi:hypothetical protein
MAGTQQQQPTCENQDVAGTSSGGILVSASGWQHAVPTDLIDDPMLTSEILKQFQDSFKDLYKFSMVSVLHY